MAAVVGIGCGMAEPGAGVQPVSSRPPTHAVKPSMSLSTKPPTKDAVSPGSVGRPPSCSTRARPCWWSVLTTCPHMEPHRPSVTMMRLDWSSVAVLPWPGMYDAASAGVSMRIGVE
jgi:hypothetical protein